MVVPNGSTRANGKAAVQPPKQSSKTKTNPSSSAAAAAMTTTKPKKKSPILRLVMLAGIGWFGVFVYTHAVFSKLSVHDFIAQKKDLHPAQQFLAEGKNLRKGVAHVRRMTFKKQATSACERTIHDKQVPQCISDLSTLYHMDERIAYHYIKLLKNSKEKDLRGLEGEHPCMRINLASHRSSCYQDIMAVGDLTVARKMAELLKEKAEDDGVTVHDAKIACALARERDLCLHDVLGTRDLEIADAYDKLPAPRKDQFGKFILDYRHHSFTEKNAIQSCKMVHPDDRKKCQEHVMKLDDEETAEHYIHLLQDQEHHQEDAKVMTQDEAESLCEAVKVNEYQEQCLEDIASLPNRHMADHFIQLYDEQQADSLVSQLEAEKLCHHLRLTHHKHKYESCIQNLTQMKGIQAASHYSKLLSLHKKIEEMEEDPAEREIITPDKAVSVCQNVQPKERQVECQADVQTMNDWDTAEKYARLLSPEDKTKKEGAAAGDQGGLSATSNFKIKAAEVCGRTMHEEAAPQCLKNLIRLYHDDERAALHFINLLNNSKAQNLKGADAEHPCERIRNPPDRSTCYQDTLATRDLTVARKMGELLKAQMENYGVTEHDAQIACALAHQKGLCIFDVLAIGDLEVADTYDQLPLPAQDQFGKFLLQAEHHRFREADAVQACKKKQPEEQKKCQELVLKMDDEETAEHYIHLNKDQQHHEQDTKVMTEDEANSLCTSVKIPDLKKQCQAEISNLPNRHMAEHFIQLFSDQQASSLVSQLDAEKLCHHVKLSHPGRKLYVSCVKSLTQLNGAQAASHYSKLLKLHKKMVQVEEDDEDKVYLTKAKASSICAKVKPQERQEECQKDVQTMNDWVTAERYAQLLAPDTPDGSNAGDSVIQITDAEEACKKSIHPDDIPECIEEIINLSTMNSQVARHFMGLLSTSGERNLEGSEAEHPCMKLNADTHRATCYQHVLATSKLGVARKMAQFLKADEDHKPGVTLHDATIACALSRDKGNCIHDVLGTGDLDVAEAYDNHAAPGKDEQGKLALHAHHHHMTWKEAEQACKMVHPDDQEKCQKHVSTMDDEETATHYIHLLLDAEHHLDTSTAISESEASTLCAAVKDTKHHQQCLHDVHMLPNQHMAEHLVSLYDEEHASEKVSLQDAQQLCNHLRLSKKQNNHASCVKHLTGVTGIEAAAHFSKLLQQSHLLETRINHQAKALLTKSQADSVCGELKPYELKEECRRDVLTLNDIVVAQHYAQHFANVDNGQQTDESETAKANGGSSKATIMKQGEQACKRSIHPDDVSECIQELRKLTSMDPVVAQHFIQLLMTIKDDNLGGAEAEHPCLAIDLQMPREACYQDVLATNDLVVAKQMAQMMKEKADKESKGVTLHDASIACALAAQKALCIHDVMGTMDLEAADAYDKLAAPQKNKHGKFSLQAHHHRFSEKDAIQACRLVHKDDKEKCKEHVLTMDDEDTAEHYIHLLQDVEHHSDTDTSSLGMDMATSLCASIKNTQHHQQCLQDISTLPNEHIASHFIPLYDENHASEVLSQPEAEKLCNHVRLSQKDTDHDSCIKYLTQTKGVEAASRCSKLLQQSLVSKPKTDSQKEKKLLTKEEAETVCKKVKAETRRGECQQAAQTMNDMEVAQRFAALLDPKGAAEKEKDEPFKGEGGAAQKQGESAMSPERTLVKEKAEAACGKTIHKDDVQQCIEDVLKLDIMNPQVSRHYVRLLMGSKENNLEGVEAEHPCMQINSQTHRAACYQDVLATNDLAMAKKLGNLMKGMENLEPVQVSLHDATIACALAIQKGTCIHDVMGTGDLEAADMYEKHAAPQEDAKGELQLQAAHHRLSQKEAEQACKMVHPDDREECQKQVMTMDDEETAKHYIHLLQDSEHHSNIATTISEADAKSLCDPVKSTKNQQQCLNDVRLLPNKHMAEHLILLYDDQHATELVSKQDAEKLCNHLRLKNQENSHDACMRYLTKTKGLEAAAHASNLLRIVQDEVDSALTDENQKKELLTAKEVDSVCGQLKVGKTQEECKEDVKSLSNLDVAQRYAQLLAKKK